MAHVGIATSNYDETVDGLVTYFASSHVPGKCERTMFEQYMSAVACVLLELIPLSVMKF